MDDLTLGKLLTEAHRGQVDYFEKEGVSVSQLSSSVMFDGSGQPDGERVVDQSGKSGVTFNVIGAHSNFSEDIQIERMVDRSGHLDERNSSKTQIRTLLEEQRQTIIAEYREKISHHELQAAQAEEEERRLLQGQLWRQKLEFREAHQRSLTEMEELRKFQSSAFDTLARRRFIEDQNTILELSGKVQELQNEVNCMNDSRDFQDACTPGTCLSLSKEEELSVGQSSSVSERTGRPVGDRAGRPVESIGQELHVANAQIRTLLDRQKERILADCQAQINRHKFQADYDRRSLRTFGEIVESQREELHCTQAEELQRRDQQLLQGQLLQQNLELREAHQKSLNEIEELKKFQSSTFDTIARRRLVEDQDTILELTGKIQELQSEINCMNDSKNFQDAESIRSRNSHVTS